MSLQIKGLEKAMANYSARARASTLTSIVNKGAAIVEGEAKLLAPVDTGALRSSIKTTQVSNTTASVNTSLEYAPHQEFGTVNQPAQPFMHPAAQHSKSKIKSLAIDQINKAMKV